MRIVAFRFDRVRLEYIVKCQCGIRNISKQKYIKCQCGRCGHAVASSLMQQLTVDKYTDEDEIYLEYLALRHITDEFYELLENE